MAVGKFTAGDNPAMDLHPMGSRNTPHATETTRLVTLTYLLQLNLDYLDLGYWDFSITWTWYSGPIFFHEYL